MSSPVLVGRAAEVASLRAALERAVAGKPSAVIVAGEAGVGKTRLVTELSGQARQIGAITLMGGCLDVGDGVLAYAPVVEATRSLAAMLDEDELERVLGGARDELARLVPELGTPAVGSDPVAPARLFELLLGVLHRLAERRPVLLIAEDLHWADQSTRDLLGFLVRNLRAGVCTVLTYRSDDLHRRHPLRPFLAELGRSDRIERLQLGSLGRRDVAGLLAEITRERPSAATVAEIHERSAGNPFFVEELLAARWEGTALPTAVRDVVLARVEALSEPAQRVLQVAAVAGRRVDHHVLAAVSAQSVEELIGVLREAVARHVLTAEEGSESYAFRHALVQEAIYDDLLPAERGPLHGAYARALSDRVEARAGAATAAELGQLAYHWYAAHDLGAALLACVEAGQAAEAAYALAEAQRHYERAVELWNRAPQSAARSPLDRVTLLQRAAEAAYLIGEHDQAIALAETALADPGAARDPLRTGALLERLARYHWMAGDSAKALTTIEQAVSALPAQPPSRERARALAARGQLLMLMARHRQASESCEEAIAVARQVGARAEEGHALTSLATSLGLLGRLEPAREHFEEAFRIAEEVGSIDDMCRARLNFGGSLTMYGLWEEAAEVSLECYRLASRFGAMRTYGRAGLGNVAEALVFLGRWEEALPMLEEVFELDPPNAWAPVPLQTRALYHLHRGDLAGAREDLSALLKNVPLPLDPQYAAPQLARTALIAMWDGHLDEARAAVADGVAALADDDGGFLIFEVCQAGLAVEAAIAERTLALRAADEYAMSRGIAWDLLDRARAAGAQASAIPLAQARLATSEAEWTRVEGAGDPDRWAEAADAWQRLSCPHETAYAQWRHGEALLATGTARATAEEVLRRSWTTASELGARLLVQEIEDLARRARVSLEGPPGATEAVAERAEPGGDFGLTPREREVLALVTTGHTNRQIAQALFISDKTASVHVSNILAKLGAANRMEAAAIAHRLGLG
ncbi:helix-turn-helix transcriptional regulator [Planotetraspora thailandica]|uniref:Helix-turn-helix transcriptional regulator n=1 Tax=Planotetraspora thailandica TaxID=487172 RepID=A0A8J3VDG5_9ACTN|nr:helix-turn-helix transcriptional regulator [Planotetraspora thailandica]